MVDAGVAFACVQAGGVAGRIGWGLLAGNAVGSERLLVGLGLITALGLAFLVTLTSAWPFTLVAAVSLVLGVSGMGWNGVLLAQIATLAPPGRAAEATAGLQLVMFLGSVITPVLFATIVVVVGYGLAYALLIGFILAGICAIAPVCFSPALGPEACGSRTVDTEC